jgi:hypothetical protein
MPIAAFLWFIGWGLYFVGFKRAPSKPKPKLSVQNELFMFVPTQEQHYVT